MVDEVTSLELALPSDSDDRLVYYLRHIVSLTWIDVAKDKEHSETTDPKTFAVSGFVMSVKNHWFWVTAGHIFRDIEERLNMGREIVCSKFFDCWTTAKRKDDGIPFPLTMPLPHVNNEVKGMDYGVIPISNLYRALLEANGIIALDESKWNNHPLQFDAFEIIGLPTETTKHEFHEYGNKVCITSYIQPCAAPVQWEPSPPKNILTEFPRFYGTLIDTDDNQQPNGTPLKDINGMSGSPIFGVGRNLHGQLEYRLVAVQSGWLSDRRLICGCFVESLAEILQEWIKTES